MSRTGADWADRYGPSLAFQFVRYKGARDASIDALKEPYPSSGCSTACLVAQMDAYHKDQCRIDENARIKAVFEGDKTLMQGSEKTLVTKFDHIRAKIHSLTYNSKGTLSS